MHTHARTHVRRVKRKRINRKMRFACVLRVHVHSDSIRVYLVLVSINTATRISLFIGNKKRVHSLKTMSSHSA